jgi:cytoskeletal protein CcmA (bactofilin family)
MLQSAQNNSQDYRSNPNSYTPVKSVSTPVEQATIGRSLVIKGEVSGSESLYVDGRIEGKVSFPESRITIGRNGTVNANIEAKEVVIMGSVKGNIQCSDRLDIRSEGTLTGDIVAQRISVEDGAVLKGSVEVRTEQSKKEKAKADSASNSKSAEQPKALAAAAGVSAAAIPVAGSSVLYEDFRK